MSVSYSQLGKWGRLCNMWFEISATISTALDNNDTYAFPHWQYENDFNLSGCFYDSINFKYTYQEPYFAYKKIDYQKDLDLRGYYQAEKYFISNKEKVIYLLTPKNLFPRKQNYTSIHCRLGDYLTIQDCHPVQPMSYYKQAMNIIKSKKYLIVSDDIEWCKQNFIGDQFEFSESNDPIIDLKHQISCEHNIISNSSFSWVGSYLNNNPSKIVIAPKVWFGPKLSMHDTRDLYLPNWTVI